MFKNLIPLRQKILAYDATGKFRVLQYWNGDVTWFAVRSVSCVLGVRRPWTLRFASESLVFTLAEMDRLHTEYVA